MKRRNKSCLGVFVIGLFTVYIFIVYRWFFRESAGSKIQQDNLPTDSGLKQQDWSPPLVVSGLGLDVSFVILDEQIKSKKQEENNREGEEEELWKLSPFWVEDQRPHINPHRYGILMSPNPNLCHQKKDDGKNLIDLLIIVASAVDHGTRRDAIRETWGSNLKLHNTKLIFLLGQGRDKQSKIQNEHNLYNDILQEDFEDTYHNLTLKTIMGLKWMSIFCPQAQYVLKTDDDIYVNVDLLHKSLLKESKTLSQNIHGCIKNSPLNSPMPIPKEGQASLAHHATLMRPALPQFTAGAGYLIPGKLAPELYVASLSTKLLPVEDAYTTGFCAKKIGSHPPVNDPRFSCGQLVEKDCDMAKLFTGHKVTPERMWTIYQKLQKGIC